MLIDLAQTLIQMPIDPTHFIDLHLTTLPHIDLFHSFHLSLHLPHYDSDLFAQTPSGMIKETDLAGDVSKMWQKFVKTGQVWAFLIGAIVGYMIKTFTSFG
jgi:hypothetical protein